MTTPKDYAAALQEAKETVATCRRMHTNGCLWNDHRSANALVFAEGLLVKAESTLDKIANEHDLSESTKPARTALTEIEARK
jgi:hypothetical protein